MGSHGHPAGPLSTPPERMQLPSAPRREGLKQPMHLWAGLFAGLCQMSASVRQPRFQAKRVFFPSTRSVPSLKEEGAQDSVQGGACV